MPEPSTPEPIPMAPLSRAQFDQAVEWAAAEGWNPGLHDADVFWETDPEGYLGAFDATGDLIATCTSAQSRNRTVGYELGRGRTIEEITNEMFMVAEGVKSAPAVIALADKYGVDMPIAREVFEVIQGRSTPEDAFRGLVRTAAGAESDPG